MALYFAIPFGVQALRVLYDKANTKSSPFLYLSFRILCLLLLFTFSFILLWLPFFVSLGIIPGSQSILARIFPIRRGIFEDKVASFWCVLHNFYKVNSIWDRQKQMAVTTCVTLAACVPTGIMLWRKNTNCMFVMSLFTVSCSFFFFSF